MQIHQNGRRTTGLGVYFTLRSEYDSYFVCLLLLSYYDPSSCLTFARHSLIMLDSPPVGLRYYSHMLIFTSPYIPQWTASLIESAIVLNAIPSKCLHILFADNTVKMAASSVPHACIEHHSESYKKYLECDSLSDILVGLCAGRYGLVRIQRQKTLKYFQSFSSNTGSEDESSVNEETMVCWEHNAHKTKLISLAFGKQKP